jgi:hypothetical protein
MHFRLLLSVLAATLLLVACNTSHTEDEDAPITFDLDGALFDTGVDAPRPDRVVGDACTTDAECGPEGICLDIDELTTDGYCSSACGTDLPCAEEGTTCLNFGGGQAFCFLDCDPEATERTCERPGYGCGSNFMVLPTPVCVAGCVDDSDCGEGLSCDPTGGFTGAGACFDPAAMVGDPCTDAAECPSGGACITENGSGWPSGSCATGCDFATNAGCEGGACIAQTFGGGLCTSSCATDTDCREGYACTPVNGAPGRMYCAPDCAGDTECASAGNVCNPGVGTCDVPFDASRLGDTCRGDGQGCEGGTCLRESTNGYPGSYCIYAGCTLGGTDCPSGGVCAPGSGTVNLCLLGCDNSGDCRPGYACRLSDPADTESPRACVPACTSSAECSGGGGGGTPRTCNPGTGRCTTAFQPARSGEPCATATECPGGRCRDEAVDGWPAGMCVSIGCRLDGEAPTSPCGAGDVCVDDALGDPAIGECLPGCAVAASDCRPGYACVAEDGATDGVCRPACTATSCDSSRTCDSETGLCS